MLIPFSVHSFKIILIRFDNLQILMSQIHVRMWWCMIEWSKHLQTTTGIAPIYNLHMNVK